MATLSTCLKCRFFQGISYVYPDSIRCKEDGVPYGYYVYCGSDYHKATDVKINGAKGEKSLSCNSFQEFKRFIRKNYRCEVACPKRISYYKQTDQLAMDF
ncbi:MAG: hypothetical protein GX369_08350 [Euryarchaeota archaeon]|nr:hypothetical protein [Euryarchaeota archaeon]